MKKIFQKINLKIFIPTCLVLLSLVAILLLWPAEARRIISKLFDFCTEQFGWLYLSACIVSFGFLICLSFGEFGKIRLGEENEKPQYSNIS